jgi:hypothetical protein
MAGELRRGFDLINTSGDGAIHGAYKEAVNWMEQALKRETAALGSIRAYSARDKSVDGYGEETILGLRTENRLRLEELERHYTLACEARQAVPQKLGLTEEEKRAGRIVPRRETALKGPVGRGFLREKLKDSPESLKLPILERGGLVTYEVLNFVDGKRSLLDIRNAVSAEFGPLPLQWVEDYVRLLARAGVVILEE